MTEPKRIQLRRTKGWRLPPGCVVVARPSKWGNPWTVKDVRDVYGSRGTEAYSVAVELYRRDIENWEIFATYLNDRDARGWPDIEKAFWDAIDATGARHVGDVAAIELRGKDLACWCPLVDENGEKVPCHADVLLEIANGGEA